MIKGTGRSHKDEVRIIKLTYAEVKVWCMMMPSFILQLLFNGHR
jgi:hypothetical protein